MPENPQPNWRGKASNPPPAAGRTGGWRADKTDDSKGTGRKVKLGILVLGCVAAVAAMVWLFLLPTPPKVPTIVVVAANPTAATIDRLDVPPDVYGWLGAKALAAWTAKAGQGQQHTGIAPKLLSDDGQPYALGDPNWAWVEAIAADDKADPVVIFVGAHGTVDGDGDPALYTGGVEKDGKPGIRKLREILDKLGSDKLAKKKKVLILDPGRTPPHPAQGELVPLFTTRLKEIENNPEKAFVGRCPNLILICGSGPGERGWDSELFGQSVFADIFRTALTGQFVAQEGRSSYTAWQLFQEVEKNTTEWTRSRRPTAQTPMLFPTANGRELAEKMRLGIALNDSDRGDDRSKAPPPPLAGLKQRWEKCQELIDTFPAQPPYAYAPRLWRRYRDLLVRYDGIVRAGQESASFARDLADKLDKMRDKIEELGKLDLAASQPYSFAIPAAVGVPGQQIPTAETLLKEPSPATDPPTQPSAQLARMIVARYRDPKSAPGTPVKYPSTAGLMIATRLAAEQATLGVLGSKTGSGTPYPERLWPFLDPLIRTADRTRRQGEDRLFGPPRQDQKDWYAEAARLLAGANQAYRDAQKEIADPLRFAYQVSDRTLADLPYLTAWAAEVDETKLTGARKAWENAHKLADDLDAIRRDPSKTDPKRLKELKDNAEILDGEVKSLKDRVDNVVAKVSSAAVTANWPPTEALLTLPPPLLSAADRTGLLANSQNYLRSFDSESGVQGVSAVEKVDAKAAAARRAAAGFAGLPEADKRIAADGIRGDAEWEKEALKLGKSLREKYRELSEKAKFPAPSEEAAAKTSIDRERELAERASRLAIPFARPGDEDPEPAAETRKARWQAVLEGLALQAATDHWYDEQQKPYFKTEAEAYLKDAARMSPAAADGSPYRKPPAVTRLLALDEWAVTAPFPAPVSWTSEQQRAFSFALDKKGWTPDLEGFPACRLGLETKTNPSALLGVSPAFKDADQLLGPADAALPAVPVAIVSNEAVGTGLAFVTAELYFRGQKPRTKIEIALNRRPEWVVSNVKPRPEEGAMLAVKSDNDVSVGAISIVLDLSGSMKLIEKDEKGKYIFDKVTGKWKPDFARREQWRSTKALQTVIDLLDSFNDDAYPSVSVFVFGEEKGTGENAAMTATMPIKQLFPASGPPPEKMTRSDIDVLKAAVRRLKQVAIPEYYTPLVPSIRKALAQGFPPGYTKPKTVLVLTDGMDTTYGEIVFKDEEGTKKTTVEEKNRIVADVQRSVAEFNAVRVPIHVVFFDTDQEEEEVAKRQFDAVRRFDAPGQVWSARDAKSLFKTLDLALRPKPRLVRQNGDAVQGVPPFGLPTNRPGDRPHELRWYGREIDGVIQPTPGRYDLDLPGLDRQPIAFDDGDRLLVRIKKTADGAQFSREIFFREFPPKIDRTDRNLRRLDENADWLLAVPQNQILFPNNKQTLSLVTGLEYLKAVSPGKGGEIRHVRPQFVWWEVSQITVPKPGRDDDGVRPGYGRVENLSGYPTPAWHLTVDEWPNAAGRTFAEPRLRAWPVQSLAGLNPDPIFPNPIRLALSPRVETASTLRDRNGAVYPIRVSHEEVEARINTKGDKGRPKCAVVRIDYPPGREVYARAILTRKDGTMLGQFDEHRYYRRANGYTAIFGPVEDRDVEQGVELAIELVSVPELKKAVNPLVLDALGPPLESDPRPAQPVPQKDVDYTPGRP